MSKQKAQELLPCPFCGNTEIKETYYADSGQTGCQVCEIFMPIKIWNTRSDLATTHKEEAERLRFALRGLYEDTLDYIRINNLAGSENNHWMKIAREALAGKQKEGM